jgi:purine-nucleoside phosphorylase
MEEILKKAYEASEYIKKKMISKPQMAIVLGSGLGSLVDKMNNAVEISYSDIPNFPLTTVEGHAGRLVFGNLCGKPVLAMKGRFHYYEGYEISQVVFAVRVLKLLGIDRLIVTNAAGGINKDFKSGDLMLINDHIGFFGPSPLRGRNWDEFGPRFPDMCQVYDKEWSKAAQKAAQDIGIEIKTGVYAFMQGPMYETPAEIRALGILGADAVGMSTVPEAIVARHSGMKILGISCITNMAAGILGQPLSHMEVIEAAKNAEKKFTALVEKIVSVNEYE